MTWYYNLHYHWYYHVHYHLNYHFHYHLLVLFPETRKNVPPFNLLGTLTPEECTMVLVTPKFYGVKPTLFFANEDKAQ